MFAYVDPLFEPTFEKLDGANSVTGALTVKTIAATATHFVFTFDEFCTTGPAECPEATQNINMLVTGLKNFDETKPATDMSKIMITSASSQKIDAAMAIEAIPTLKAGDLSNVVITRSSQLTGAEATFSIAF